VESVHGNERLNKRCFRWRLITECVRRIAVLQAQFQAWGAATVKARSVTDGCTMCGRHQDFSRDAERSRRRETTSDSGRTSSVRYCGSAPLRQRCTRTHNLYWTVMLVLVLVLKDCLRTKMQSLSWSLSLTMQSLSLTLSVWSLSLSLKVKSLLTSLVLDAPFLPQLWSLDLRWLWLILLSL